jgi:hypothetical protein
VTYVVEHLLCKHEGLSLNPGTDKKKKKKEWKEHRHSETTIAPLPKSIGHFIIYCVLPYAFFIFSQFVNSCKFFVKYDFSTLKNDTCVNIK